MVDMRMRSRWYADGPKLHLYNASSTMERAAVSSNSTWSSWNSPALRWECQRWSSGILAGSLACQMHLLCNLGLVLSEWKMSSRKSAKRVPWAACPAKLNALLSPALERMPSPCSRSSRGSAHTHPNHRCWSSGPVGIGAGIGTKSSTWTILRASLDSPEKQACCHEWEN